MIELACGLIESQPNILALRCSINEVIRILLQVIPYHVKWEGVVKLVELGGLAIGSFSLRNEALLAKWLSTLDPSRGFSSGCFFCMFFVLLQPEITSSFI